MLLIYPPIAKACEPPAGIARIAGALGAHGLACRVFDANLEAQLFLMANTRPQKDPWSRRACKNRMSNLAALRTTSLYTNPDRYRRTVYDLNHLLEMCGKGEGLDISLGNYRQPDLSPLKSHDLLQMAAQPELSIFYQWFSLRLKEEIDHCLPSFIGFSLNYLSQAPTTFAMIGWVKKRYPELPVILGGGLMTSWMSNPSWNNPFTGLVEHCVAGRGEGPLLALAGKQNVRPSVPNFNGFSIKDYLAPGFILPYSASSGCYWSKCSFCPEAAEKNPYFSEAPQQTIKNIQQLLAEDNKPVLLHFLDNALSPTLMKKLTVNPPGIPWYGFVRVSSELADRDFCLALRRSGCLMLKLGIESGDRDVLDAMNKGQDIDLVSRVLTTLRDAGIATYAYLLFGTPSESRPEAESTLNFVARHHKAITFLNLAIFNLPLSGHDVSTLETVDLHEGDLSLYTNFVHPRGWNRKEVRRFLDREFRRHPRIAPIIRRDPPLFTSNHAPFFCLTSISHKHCINLEET